MQTHRPIQSVATASSNWLLQPVRGKLCDVCECPAFVGPRQDGDSELAVGKGVTGGRNWSSQHFELD